MARFSKKKAASAAAVKTNTTNLAGGKAFSQTEKVELASIMLTSFLKDQFYRSSDQTAARLTELVSRGDHQFAAKAAVYARKVFGMRSVTHLVAAVLARQISGTSWAKDFYREVIQRPDDVTEILAAYMTLYGKPITNAMRKGLGQALSGFNAYQLAKYRGEGNEVSLVDAVNLLHPKHNAQLASLMDGSIKSPETWEVQLTKAGQSSKDEKEVAAAKAAVWKELLSQKKLGYFALLKNLRNIAQQSPDSLPMALEQLQDRDLIKSSLVMPFRFSTAMGNFVGQNDIPGCRSIIAALNKALEMSLDNVPQFDGNSAIIVDHSGSMDGDPINKAALFAAVMLKAWDRSDLILFSDDAQMVQLNPQDSLFTLRDKIINATESGGTDFTAPFRIFKKKYDRMIFLSDMQGWAGKEMGAPSASLKAYKTKFKADPFIYSFDLSGYGSGMFTGKKLLAMSGFSDKIFDIMNVLETDRDALVHVIERVQFDGSVNKFCNGVLTENTRPTED